MVLSEPRCPALSLREARCLSTTHFTKDDSVGPMAQGVA
jgi:hypothetical protein